MRQPELPPRLRATADWVPPGARMADIGTDHGLLPAWLLKNGLVRSAVASDIREGPLSAARRTAERFGVADRMEFFLCDGMSGLSPGQADAVVIAGMGGETIAAILGAAPWAKQGVLFVLQPMTKLPELRDWLAGNGYRILRERLVREDGLLYTVMLAEGGEMPPLTPVQRLAGVGLENDPLLEEHLDGLTARLNRALGGLAASGREEHVSRAAELRQARDALRRAKEEWFKCRR